MKKKVLFVVVLPPPFHGVPVANSILVNSTALNQKYQLTIIPIKRKSLRQGGSFIWSTFLDDLYLICQTMLVFLKEKPDLLYFCIAQTRLGLWRDVFAIWIAKIFGKKCLVHLHGSYFRALLEEALTPVEQRIVRRALNCLNGVIVLDASLTWIFEGLIPAAKIFVLSNGIPEPYSANQLTEALKKRKNAYPMRVTFLSNLWPSKGFKTFLQSAVELHKRGHLEKFQFILAGAVPNYEVAKFIEEFIIQHGIQKSIHIKGEVVGQEKLELLLDSDIFVLPVESFEGQPIVIIEALAAGLPVISTARGCIPAMVQDGRNGYIVPEKNPKEIAERLMFLFQNTDIRLKMGTHSRHLYCSRYTAKHFDQGFINILDEVLES